MPTIADLIPVVDTWVRKGDDPRLGRVVEVYEATRTIRVDWGGRTELLPIDDVQSGIQPGFIVQDVPHSISRRTLGMGRVVARRTLAACDQALVQFQHDGRALWLPAFSLKRIMGAELAFQRAATFFDDAAERWALCLIAHALRSWNEATGALDRLDVDPLPHQIQLVHKIINSGQTNWVIADDVGLGKTIEVGLLLAALERRSRLGRVLVICPAGLTRQWQQEMRLKFDRTFEIYHHDFDVDDAWKWKLHDNVIASLDLVKPRTREDEGADFSTHFGRLLAAGTWDLVIFDEGHRLSRTDDGNQTLRFLLARALRLRTEALVLLTGTPHQGDTGKFRSLLALVRPDLNESVEALEANPEVVADIVLRNRKVDVTDADGNFIFKGHTVKRVAIDPSPEMRELDRKLQAYLRRGYQAGHVMGGFAGRAVGFVMTTYRKLASSSVAALERSLARRLERLRTHEPPAATDDLQLDFTDSTDDLSGEGVGEPIGEFFEREAELLNELLGLCKVAGEHDAKTEAFGDVYKDVVGRQGLKILVFTEYRATQERLAREVERLSGRPAAIINGAQTLDDKIAAMEAFEADCDVLISTEAGGEGLNLHRRCHIVLNFDLPWNPARLVQRIGRVYRYGQQKHVAVINFHSRDTIDSEVVSLALGRVDELSREMAVVSGEFNERYASEVLGELLEQLDLSTALKEALEGTVDRSQVRIDEAIERARRARDLQAEILSAASGFDPDALIRLGRFSTMHVMRFVTRMAPFLGIEVTAANESSERLTLKLPETLRGRFKEFGGRTVIEATTSRATASIVRSATLLDFGSSFLRELIHHAGLPEFCGGYASARIVKAPTGHVAAYLTRWQSDQGEPIGEELSIATYDDEGNVAVGNGIVASLLDRPIESLQPAELTAETRKHVIQALRDRVEVEVAARANRFKLPNDLVLLAAADVTD